MYIIYTKFQVVEHFDNYKTLITNFFVEKVFDNYKISF